MGVPPPQCLRARTHCRWYRLGRPWRRHAHRGFLYSEGCRVRGAVPGGGGGELLVRCLGAGYRSFRVCPNLSLCCSHWPGGARRAGGLPAGGEASAPAAEVPVAGLPRPSRRRQDPGEWLPGLGWRSHREATPGRAARRGPRDGQSGAKKTVPPSPGLRPESTTDLRTLSDRDGAGSAGRPPEGRARRRGAPDAAPQAPPLSLWQRKLSQQRRVRGACVHLIREDERIGAGQVTLTGALSLSAR